MATDSTGHLQRWGRTESRETFLQTFDWWLGWKGVLSRIDWEREGKRAEKTQMEEEKELRQREQAQRKKEREQKAVVRSRTTVAGPSKVELSAFNSVYSHLISSPPYQNHSAAGPSNRLSVYAQCRLAIFTSPSIFRWAFEQ